MKPVYLFRHIITEIEIDRIPVGAGAQQAGIGRRLCILVIRKMSLVCRGIQQLRSYNGLVIFRAERIKDYLERIVKNKNTPLVIFRQKVQLLRDGFVGTVRKTGSLNIVGKAAHEVGNAGFASVKKMACVVRDQNIRKNGTRNHSAECNSEEQCKRHADFTLQFTHDPRNNILRPI